MENKPKPVLRRRSEFQEIKLKGRRIHIAPWLVLYVLKNNFGHLRYGWTVSSQIGNAVVRNKVKRWCRALLSKNSQSRLNQVSYNVNFVFRSPRKNFFKEASYQEFEQNFNKAVEKIRSLS